MNQKLYFVALALTLNTITPLCANPADLDPTFDTDGKQTIQFSVGNAYTYSALAQPDGKVIAAGFANTFFAIARLTNTGALDTTFNSTGTQTIAIGTFAQGFHALLQSDNKIIVTGRATVSGQTHFAATRLTSAGQLDTSFNTTGTQAISFPGYTGAHGFGSILQNDSKIVFAGTLDNAAVGAIRLNTDGSLDTSYNGTGRAIIPVVGGVDLGAAIALQADGKTVVASNPQSSSSCMIARLNTDGTLDTSFGVTGTQTISFELVGTTCITVQSDGKILICGANASDAIVARLTSSGDLDTSFNGTGTQTITIGTSTSADSILVQPTGKIILAGRATVFGLNRCFVARLLTNGSLDSEFNGTGYTTFEIGDASSSAKALAFQNDGKIIIGADASIGGQSYLALARLLGNSCCDTIRLLKALFR